MPFKMLSIFDFPFFGLAFFKQALTNLNKTEHAVQSYVARKEAIEAKNITAINVISYQKCLKEKIPLNSR